MRKILGIITLAVVLVAYAASINHLINYFVGTV